MLRLPVDWSPVVDVGGEEVAKFALGGGDQGLRIHEHGASAQGRPPLGWVEERLAADQDRVIHQSRSQEIVAIEADVVDFKDSAHCSASDDRA
jgi:hypothetical protein